MKKITIAIVAALLAQAAFSQDLSQKPDDGQSIRISVDLVQADVVVTDKNGKIVRGLTKEDFELYESGKKQFVSFFEFVEGTKPKQPASAKNQPDPSASGRGVAANEVGRIFGFVVDDLTIPYQDLILVRQMLTNFIDTQMQPTDLVAIVRTVGGKGLLQQFSSDKELLRRAVAALTMRTHPFSAFNNPDLPRLPEDPNALIQGEAAAIPTGASPGLAGADVSGESADIGSAVDETNKMLRAYMSLGTASFVIDSLRGLPGRKSLILISGGLPILSTGQASVSGNVSYSLNLLADKATRAGVAINTMDIRGLQAHAAVAGFADTPGRSALGSSPISGSFGRAPDESIFGYRNPFDQTQGHQGLRALAYATGGVPVLNKNDFNEGLGKILAASEGYYLLAYTPSNNKFDGKFRKVDIKVKGEGLRVYNRLGYIAREDKPLAAPETKKEQLLAAMRSPLARRDIDLDAIFLYKAASADQCSIDINIAIDPRKLSFEQAGEKQQANYDIAGFVFDELGQLQGGFSETVTAKLTPEDLKKTEGNGVTFSAHTVLKAGIYQIRIAARDNKTGNIGTLSRYLEVPDVSGGKLTASSLLLGAAAPNSALTTASIPITASRRISRKQDLRYAVAIYNAKQKDGKPQLRTQLVISQAGQIVFKEQEEPLAATNTPLKLGQLALAGVKPGRYTMTLIITDTLADKKAQIVARSMDFEVVN